MRAATLWRGVLTCVFVLALCLALVVRNRADLPSWTVLPAVIGGFFFLQGLLVAASLIAGRALSGASAGPLPVFATLRMIALESWHFSLAQVAMSLHTRRRGTARLDATGTCAHRPVLLVHGLACNRNVWWLLRRRLRAAGFASVHGIDLEPLSADIEQLARVLAREVARLQREYPGERLTIVAHSMGGLIARAMLQLPEIEPIGHLITLATPHDGAALARALHWDCARQMRRGSAWLARLNVRSGAEEPRRGPRRMTCILSTDDNFVVPATSAALAGAAQFSVHGLGHFGLLVSHRAWRLVMRALQDAP